jgi:hypothetical protein
MSDPVHESSREVRSDFLEAGRPNFDITPEYDVPEPTPEIRKSTSRSLVCANKKDWKAASNIRARKKRLMQLIRV